jgi:hypothetical protein
MVSTTIPFLSPLGLFHGLSPLGMLVVGKDIEFVVEKGAFIRC